MEDGEWEGKGGRWGEGVDNTQIYGCEDPRERERERERERAAAATTKSA